MSVLRKAASDPAFLSLMAGIGGAGAVTHGAGLLDLIKGGTHGGNSGEIPLNTLIALLATASPLSVGIASLGLDPVLNEAVTQSAERDELRRLAEKEVRGGKIGMTEDDVEKLVRIHENNVDTPELNKVLEKINKQAVEKGTTQALSREQILKHRLRRGGLATLGAAGVGAVPAILAMKDQPAESLPVG